jgi:hypothetical protein
MHTETYDEACRRHADGQGLRPAEEALAAAGVPSVLDQTGGFTMCLRPLSGAEEHPGDWGGAPWVWVTHDEGDVFLVCRYPAVTDESDAYPGEPTHDDYVALADLAVHCRRLLSLPEEGEGGPE